MAIRAVSLISSDSVPFTWHVAVFQVKIDENGNPYWFECDLDTKVPPPAPVVWNPGNPPVKSQYLLGLALAYSKALGLPVLRNLYHGCTVGLELSPLELLSCSLDEE